MVKPARLSRGRRALGGEGLWGAVFLLPTLVGFLVFTLDPGGHVAGLQLHQVRRRDRHEVHRPEELH